MDVKARPSSESPEAPRLLSRPIDWGKGLEPATSFALPVGTVTLLLADIAGSTKLWESNPDEMRASMQRYDAIVEERIAAHGGVRPRDQGEGDSFLAAFSRASDGLACALELQLALSRQDWGNTPIRIRAALHTGDVQLRDDANYIGRAVNRCARLRSTGHGGQTLLSQSTYELVVDRLPTEVELKDLGVHPLRDLSRPEHIYQLVHPKLITDFPPLISLDTLPNNLPPQLTSFVGRDREIEEVKGLLSQSRIVTLTGSGGAGKTRLALQVAADSLDTFEGGVWFVNLAPVSQPEGVTSAVIDAIGQADPTGGAPNPLPPITSFFGRRRSLLVLDNCEHLIEACSQLVEALVKDCPGLVVMATSREPLGAEGETSWRVPSLTLPEDSGHIDVRTVTQCEAVQLFIDRAKRSRADFQITEDNAPAIAEITFQLDGIPLAIELAAARSRVLTPQQILEGLTNRFGLLASRSRTVLPRQQTLLASVDWSYRLLTEPERLLLRRLSVFVGGCDLGSAEAVCSGQGLGTEQVLDILSLLVDKSLVLADEAGGGFRYRLLETVREFASDRLSESGERKELELAHAQHFLSSLQTLSWITMTLDEIERWTLDLGNLEASYDRFLEADRREDALRLLIRSFFVSAFSGHAELLFGRFDELLQRGSYPDVLAAQALIMQGTAASTMQNYPAAVELIQKGVDIFDQIDDRDSDPIYALAMSMLLNIAGWTTGPDQAITAYEEALRLASIHKSSAMRADALIGRGYAISIHGDRKTGRELIDEGLRILPREHNQAGGLLFQAALEAYVQGDFRRSLPLYEDAIPIMKRWPYKLYAQWALDHASRVAYTLGDFEKCRRYVDDDIAMSRKAGLTWGNYWGLLVTKSWLEEDAGKTDEARHLLQDVLALIDQSTGADATRGRLRVPYLLALANLEQNGGNHREALLTFRSGLRYLIGFERYQGPTGKMVESPVGAYLRSMARSELELGRVAVAARFRGAAEARQEIEGSDLGRLTARHDQAVQKLRSSSNLGRLDAEWKLGASLIMEDMIAYGLGAEEDVERSDLVDALFLSDAIEAGGLVDDIPLDDAIGSLRRGVATDAPLARCLLTRSRRLRASKARAEAEDTAHEALAIAGRTSDSGSIAEALEILGGLAAEAESYVEAARLLAAASTIWDELGYMPVRNDPTMRESDVQAVRTNLSNEDFDSTWNEGASMSAAQAIAYASKGRGERKRPSSGWESLTPSELQVAELVAEGLTNPQIAERLFLSKKTVQHHVSNILAKLGVPARAGIAAEAGKRGRDR